MTAQPKVSKELDLRDAGARSSTENGFSKPPFLGFGLGLRSEHYSEILDNRPPIDWFEILSENFMVPGGQPLKILDQIRASYPIVMHGVSLSIASTGEPNWDYLRSLKALAERVEPRWVSDHLCWTGVHGVNLHDLLPIPYTQEALGHICSRVQLVQEYLGRELVLENVSTYVDFAESEMPEWEFLSELTRRTGCWLLFDVNNVYVSARNHGYDPVRFLEGIPADRVVQFHLAGHSDMGDYIIDTHDHPVSDEVFELYRKALDRFGPVSTMIERDDNIPPLADLLEELERARRIAENVLPSQSLLQLNDRRNEHFRRA
ncbi:MAG: DUF692 domain-containing protein [Alphaproteobacteria bacterium]|nr:DUF692 domain-containing protein [Alphaproteobacteria bacterium]